MKYIRKKAIKGIEYYYFEFAFMAVSGEKIVFTKYLGKRLPVDLKSRVRGFFEEISELAIGKLDRKIVDYFPPNGINKIEKARAWYHYLNHELCEEEFKLFKDLFIVLFVLNSNRAEGSRVTREEIEKIINKKRKPRTKIDREIVNSFDALNFAFSEKMKWNTASIKKIHRLLFNGLDDEIKGKYKKENNVVGRGGPASITTSKEEVKGEMNSLMGWFNKMKKRTYPPILALKFHWRFEQTHPFQDGNGRVGRILLNALLLDSFFMPVIFFSENHHTYGSSIARAIEGRENKIGKYFAEQLKKTLNRIKEYKQEGRIKGGSSSIGRWEIQKGRIRVY
ncbi:MAG: Fic family protein [Nanoarchaeota archaeon]|nr:Fic family protein [Nanoarchaeota archaeon]